MEDFHAGSRRTCYPGIPDHHGDFVLKIKLFLFNDTKVKKCKSYVILNYEQLPYYTKFAGKQVPPFIRMYDTKMVNCLEINTLATLSK